MATVTQIKCACDPCSCIVSLDSAVMKDGQPYCSENCANGHPDGSGCGHASCTCHT